MKIQVTHLDTNEVEELEVTSFNENSYTVKQGKGTMVTSFADGSVEIKEVQPDE